jgi:hypothetical protein
MCQHNQMVVEAAARIALMGLERAIADADDGRTEDFFVALSVAVQRAMQRRPHDEALFLCLAVSAILAGRGGEMMPMLREALSPQPRKPAAVTPSDN